MATTAEAGSSGTSKIALVIVLVVAIAIGIGFWVYAGRSAAPPADENSMETAPDHGVPPPMPYGSPQQPSAKPAAEPQQSGETQSWGQ